MVYLSPAGLASAATNNSVSLLATFKEKLCKYVYSTSTNQPQATITYSYETPILNDTTVFVPVVANISIITPGCKCNASTQVITEKFYVSFFGQTALPTSVNITQNGQVQGLIKIVCGKSNCFAVNSAITVSITPAA